MKRIFLLLTLSTFAFGISELVRQVVKDPVLVGKAWGLGDSTVQFNQRADRNGKWEVRFDRDTFRKITGREPFDLSVKRLQPVAKEQGAAVLWVEAQGQSYVFETFDHGLNWRLKSEAKKTTVAIREKESTVDLSALNSDTKAGTSVHAHHGGGVQPAFKILFDLLLHLRPGISPWTFDNYHGLFLVDFMPRPEMQFSFEVSPTPRYYEFDYQVTKSLQVRAGRIWIPFDDLNPHNLFGGFINTSRMRDPNAAAFLPDIWTDLGLGVKYQFLDTTALSIVSHLYVVNGFQSGGTDPVSSSTNYPQFAGTTNIDNNTDKAIGGRVHLDFGKIFGIGASGYTCTYTAQEEDGKRMILFGIDSQLRLSSDTTLRGGYTYQTVQLPAGSLKTSYLRGGMYLDLSQKFFKNYLVNVRGGVQQADDRVTDLNDQTWVGGRLGYETELWQLYGIYMRDLNGTPDKRYREFTAFRFVVTL